MRELHQMKRVLAKHLFFLSVAWGVCLACQEITFAFSEEITGYYMGELNECPNALSSKQKTNKWSGVTITPIDITFADGQSCSLSDESRKVDIIYLTFSCPNDLKRSGVYGFDIHESQLTLIRKNERQTYVRCQSLSMNSTNNLSAKERKSTGIDLGGGAKVHPYANNNSMRMKMNVPFP